MSKMIWSGKYRESAEGFDSWSDDAIHGMMLVTQDLSLSKRQEIRLTTK